MGRNYIHSLRSKLADTYIIKENKQRADEIMLGDDYSPVFKPRLVHPESEPDMDELNDMLQELIYDITIVSSELGFSGNLFKSLLDDADDRIKHISKDMLIAEERRQDMNIICNKYDADNIMSLTEEDFSGDFDSKDNVFSAKALTGEDIIDYEIVSIDGNGYEGNKFVYKDPDGFVNKLIDTSNREYLKDDSKITLYEYSRIVADSKEKEIFPEVNFDSIAANCTITIQAESAFNKVNIISNSEGIELTDLQISEDGVVFKSLLDQSIKLNDKDSKYEVFNYIPGSGIISFPHSKFLKLSFKSTEYDEEIIAFEKNRIENILKGEE